MNNLEETDKFLECYHLPRLNQEEIENMNSLIISNEIETVIKNLPTNRSPGPDGSTGKSYQTFREELITCLTLPENYRRRDTPKLTLQDHHQLP